MIIGNFDIERVTILEPETNPPLIVDADAVLSGAIAAQRLKAVRWRQPQIIQSDYRIQLREPHRRAFQNILRQTA